MKNMRPGPKPKGKVKCEWSPEFAYAVGLIATDGCLSGDGRHLELTSKDTQQLKNFMRCLGIKNKIGTKASGYSSRRYYRVQFGDKLFYDFLLEIGLSSAKSKTLKELKVSKKYFFDFLRGTFDGDGSIYAYWDPRWHSSYMFYVQLASASIDFLRWVEQQVFKLAHVHGKIKPSGRIYQLVYAKGGSMVLLGRMYYNEKLVCLKRKKDKIDRILRVNEKHKNARVS